MARNDERDDLARRARESIDVSDDGTHAAVSVPGTTGHHEPGERAAVAKESLSDERLDAAEHVTAAVPRGDTEVLDEVRRQLHTDDTRPAGASVMVQGSKKAAPDRKET